MVMRMNSSRRQFLFRGMAGCAGLWLAARAQAQLDADLVSQVFDWMDSDAPDWLRDLGAQAATEVINRKLAEHAPELLRMAEQALAQTDPDVLADAQPYLQTALLHAREVPQLAPYADWLETKMPYFEAARRARALIPVARPAPTPPASRPTPRPPPPTAAQTKAQRKRYATSDALWKKMISPAAPARREDCIATARKEFRVAGLPDAAVWMAEVESNFNPKARSPVGAAGLFQLMPATAKSLGLSLHPADQRLDPALNARAAARYVRQLYARFSAWPLTFAAYNAGPARVAALLKKKGARGFEEIAGDLPAETQMYVPRILETIRLRERINPDRLPAPRLA